MESKISWQAVVIFVVTLLACSVLVYFGKAHVEILSGPLGLLVPLGLKQPPESTKQSGATP